MVMVCQEVIVFVIVKEQQSVHRVRAQEISDILTATGGSQIKTVVAPPAAGLAALSPLSSPTSQNSCLA